MQNLSKNMIPLSIDKFDLLILKQLYPNFKLTIEELMNRIEKQLLKDLESLAKFDLRKYHNLEKSEPLTDEHILSCGFSVLFGFDSDELFYEIDTRLNEKLAKLQVEEDGYYQLTKYGIQIYTRIGVQSKERVKVKVIDIKEITDLSTMKIKTIIANNHENPDKKVILTLTQQNLKQAKFNYWEITKRPIYIKGIENEVGIFKTIFYFQFTPPPPPVSKYFTLLSFVTRNNVLGDYLLLENTNREFFKVKSAQIEPFIQLDGEYWNYNEGMFESLRGGIILCFQNAVLGTGIILGFDNCEVQETQEDYLGLTVLNLLDMELSTKDKDLLQIPIVGNKILILQWVDLENQLDLERRAILKKKNALKRAGEEAMLIRIEGGIRKKEILVENNHQKTYIFLEDPEIERENF